jgi:cytochrome c-type biogenesis protein CcmF
VQPTHEAFIAEIQVTRGQRTITTLYPEKRLYFAQNQPTTEVALRTSLFEDLYVIMAGFEPSGIITLKVFINPLVSWLWIGGLVIIIGTLIAIWPERRLPDAIRPQTSGQPTTAAAPSVQS